jgi:hypothetical protein
MPMEIVVLCSQARQPLGDHRSHWCEFVQQN